MAVEYNTTGFIKPEDRVYCNLDTMQRGTKAYNTVEILLYFYNRFQEILTKRGSLTEEDLEKVYNEQPYYLENTHYMRHYIFDRSNDKYYYVTSKPFKTKTNSNIRVELTCIKCGEKYSTRIRNLSYNQKCYCQYREKVILPNIEHLKQTDEIYLKYHKDPIGNTGYFIDDISYNHDHGLQYTYVIKCSNCGLQKEVTINDFKYSLDNYSEQNLFSQKPICNCNQGIGFKTQSKRYKEIETELRKSKHYIRNSFKRLQDDCYSIQYKCSICGNFKESTLSGFKQLKSYQYICSSCNSSITGKTNVYSMMPDNY